MSNFHPNVHHDVISGSTTSDDVVTRGDLTPSGDHPLRVAAPLKMDFFSSHKKLVMWSIAVFFYGVYVWFPVATGSTYNSPDETANAFFAEQLAQRGSLWYAEPINLSAFDRVHPRSTESHSGLVSPSVFWGISLWYGMILVVFGVWLAPFLGALVAVLGSFIFYLTLKRLWNERVAFFSWILLLAHPAFWYYASRPWYHTVLFVSLLIGLLLLVFVIPTKVEARPNDCSVWRGSFLKEIPPLVSLGRNDTYSLLVILQNVSIFLLSFAAVTVRPVEFLWIIPCLALAAWKWKFPRSIALWSGIACGVLVVLGMQYLFSNPFLSPTTTSIAQTPHSFFSNLFPNGWHPLIVARTFFYYYSLKMWWYTLPLAISLFYFIIHWKNETLTMRRWIIAFVVVTTILVLWYGSWDIRDNPDPRAISLGNSYMRYFLPSFILGIPIIASFLCHSEQSEESPTHSVRGWIIVGLLFLFSAYSIFTGPDNLITTARQLSLNKKISAEVSAITPKNAIIISNRHDKLFFGERRVMFPIDDPGTFESIDVLQSTTPFFVYRLKFNNDEMGTYNQKLAPLGLHLSLKKEFGNEALYELQK